MGEIKISVSWLFETHALKIAPADDPFFYTSGLIGPYYINAHYLCGGEEKAQELLAFIEEKQDDRKKFPVKILSALEKVYDSHEIYQKTVDAFVATVRERYDISEIRYVSGGQRRDWFFSPIVAKKLDKPCLYIYNDLSVVDQQGKKVEDLQGAYVLNVADLLTVGSSYLKKWIPAIKAVKGKLRFSVNGVDRKQGGDENLWEAGVRGCISLFAINQALFHQALGGDYIDSDQHRLVMDYLDNPSRSMREFLMKNPQFIEQAKASTDERRRKRIQTLLNENLYKLKS